jgi:hypothetical protein
MSGHGNKGLAPVVGSLPEVAAFGKGVTPEPGPGTDAGADPGTTVCDPTPGSSAAAPASRRPRRRKLPPLPEEIRQTLSATAKEFRARHGKVDRDTADRVARVFRALIVQHNKGGRKITAAVALAIALDQQGKKWAWIYSQVIPGFGSLPFCMRRYLSDKLRHAVRFHLRKAKTRSVVSRRSVYAQ